jgi:putative DNA methylase
MPLENHFDAAFTAALALKEKQIQQNYRPVIGVHKWFARRPGTLFRNLLLAEFNGAECLDASFFRAHTYHGVIADPFMGGGTPLLEANRLGFHVVGTDINPMAHWIVQQELGPLDDEAFVTAAAHIREEVGATVEELYRTECSTCGDAATVKYFLWVKTQACPSCGLVNDLFPGYLLAENVRHPKNVLACSDCLALVELDTRPSIVNPAVCPHCGGRVHGEGSARRTTMTCRGCEMAFSYPNPDGGPPQHRMWAIEYHCARCKPHHTGRFFKAPTAADLARVETARAVLAATDGLPIPGEAIPRGDETNRLHRWGYRYWRDMFNARQLLGLGFLYQAIGRVPDAAVRHALLTVFSDSLRYQNMLCRYDTYALKCQDIFSIHGFPVGLVQCENNLLGIQGVGSGGFGHFIEKYRRAKDYCRQPFESRQQGKAKRNIPITGETIAADPVLTFPAGSQRQAYLLCAPATSATLPPHSLDGVFTDPPYFANVQYAELMDFCYVWLRQELHEEFPQFEAHTTRAADELTGNVTVGRDLAHFTGGLSAVYVRFAAALKPGAPFVFTYHHNDIGAYAPLVVALLDADLLCTAVLPAPAEMEASLHINKTTSSILDSVFVSRREWRTIPPLPTLPELERLILNNCRQVSAGGVRVSLGDARCLTSGHIARLCVQYLREGWRQDRALPERLADVQRALRLLADKYNVEGVASRVVAAIKANREQQLRLFSVEGERHAAAV